MACHSLQGGAALAAIVGAEAGGNSGSVGLGTALVIVLHKPFVAMRVSTLMAASGCPRFSRHLFNTLFTLVTPLVAILFYTGLSYLFGSNAAFLRCVLAFCAGSFLCIACADLLPELQFHSHDRLKLSLALAAGLSVAVLIVQFGTHSHECHQQSQVRSASAKVPVAASVRIRSSRSPMSCNTTRPPDVQRPARSNAPTELNLGPSNVAQNPAGIIFWGKKLLGQLDLSPLQHPALVAFEAKELIGPQFLGDEARTLLLAMRRIGCDQTALQCRRG